MKVGILTFHMAHNYGAMLQAYALNSYMQKLGVQSEVIDYRLEYIDRWHRNPRRKELVKQNGFVVGMLKWIRRCFCGYYSQNGKKCRFENFMTKEMGISPTVCKEDFESGNIDYDLILFGSDQIWNADLTGGICKEYFGGFSSKAIKVSYAASKGEYSFLNKLDEYKKLLNNLDMIGVREKALEKEIKEMGIHSAETVIDPTLLISKEQWERMANSNYRQDLKDYILMYSIKEDQRMLDLAREIAVKENKHIVYIVYEKKELNDICQIDDAGPKEFLELFRRADKVITNSFHGTCFSILFEREFLVVEKMEGDSRIRSLLSDLDLMDRIVSKKHLHAETIDYVTVKHKLEDKKLFSKKFIEKAISLVKV